MTNLKKIYQDIFGTDAERRTHIESNAKNSAAMFQPRLLTGPVNEPGDTAYLRNVVPPIVFDYLNRFYPGIEPETALGRMATKQSAAREKSRENVRKAATKDGMKKDTLAFKEWKEKRMVFETNLVPVVKGVTLDWGIHEVPGLGEKYDFSIFLNRAFAEVSYTAKHDTLVRRTLDAYIGHKENRIISVGQSRIMFTVEYAARGA